MYTLSLTYSILLLLLPIPTTSLPPPQSSSCAQISFTAWSWSISSFTFHSLSKQTDDQGEYLSFTLFHPAMEDQSHQLSCSTYSPTGFDGKDWYDCRRAMMDAAPGPDWGWFGARFSWEWREGEGEGTVTVVEKWLCDVQGDGDSGGFGEGERIYFNATGSATVKLDCDGVERRDGEGEGGEEDLAGLNCKRLDFSVKPSEIRATA